MSVLNQVDGCRILADLPEVGVVQPQDPADQHLVDHTMGNKNNGRSVMGSNHFLAVLRKHLTAWKLTM